MKIFLLSTLILISMPALAKDTNIARSIGDLELFHNYRGYTYQSPNPVRYGDTSYCKISLCNGVYNLRDRKKHKYCRMNGYKSMRFLTAPKKGTVITLYDERPGHTKSSYYRVEVLKQLPDYIHYIFNNFEGRQWRDTFIKTSNYLAKRGGLNGKISYITVKGGYDCPKGRSSSSSRSTSKTSYRTRSSSAAQNSQIGGHRSSTHRK